MGAGKVPDSTRALQTAVLQSHPFALSLSKGASWFDKLTMNGFRALSNHPQRSLLRHLLHSMCPMFSRPSI